MVRYHSLNLSRSLIPTLSLAGDSHCTPKPQPPNGKERKGRSGFEAGSRDQMMNEDRAFPYVLKACTHTFYTREITRVYSFSFFNSMDKNVTVV